MIYRIWKDKIFHFLGLYWNPFSFKIKLKNIMAVLYVCMVHGAWCMVYGVYGVWCMVHGI